MLGASLISSGRRSSDGTGSSSSQNARPNRRVSELPTSALPSSDLPEPTERRSAWNRSASFKSSLNSQQLEDILNADGDDDDDDDDPKYGTNNRKAPQSSSFDDSKAVMQTLIASKTINGIGAGDRRGRNELARELNIAGLGGINGQFVSARIMDSEKDKNYLPESRSETVGDIGIDERPNLGGSSDRKAGGGKYNRRGSFGDTLLVPTYQPRRASDDHSGRYRPKRASDDDLGRNREEEEEEEGEKKMPAQDTVARKAAPGLPSSNSYDAGGQRRYTTDEANGSTKLDLSDKLGEINLEDLVPTRRPTVSRENSQKNGEFTVLEEGEGGNVEVQRSPVLKPVTRRGTLTETEEAMVGQWKKQQLMMSPAVVDFSLGASATSTELAQYEVGDQYDVPTSFAARKSPGSLGALGKPISTSTDDSFATARSRASSSESLVALEIDTLMAQGEDQVQEDDANCPRSQFVLLKSQNKSQSGATGQTQGTSSSSLPSSNGSVNNENTNTATNGSNAPMNFEAIKEEERTDVGNSIGNSAETRERVSGDMFEIYTGDAQGLNTYQRRRTGRIKKMRKSIQKSLMGVSSNNSRTDESHYSEVGSHATGSGISVEQQERVSRHLQRKSSTRSVTSAFSSLSAVTSNSDASTARSNKSTRSVRWPKFPKGLRRASMGRKAKSMHNVNGPPLAPNGSSRQILIDQNNAPRRSQSNISNLSNRSSISNLSDSSSQRSSRFTDFYDHNDHARALSSLISHKSPSGRSLVTSLETVTEKRHERSDTSLLREEQKYDEDTMHEKEEKQRRRPSADSCNSDDTMNSYYRHPSHEHFLVHMRPSQLFPDSPGWQCDLCDCEEFDSNVWAYVSTDKNYSLCQRCFSKSGFSVDG